MLRAIISASQRGKFAHLVVTARVLDHAILDQLKLRPSSRIVVRSLASGDDKIKDSIGVNPRGIIGTISSPTSITGTTNCEPIACAQTAAMGTNARSDDDIDKPSNCSDKRGDIPSQIHGTPSITKYVKIDDDESSCKSPVGKQDNAKTGSGSNFTDDAIKQLQDVTNNLPSKAQVEKFLFRVIAFVYDISFLTATWTVRFVNHNIAQNPTVQQYWKRFHEKMEEAKKD